MATINIAVNYPDGQGPAIMAALKTHWTTTDSSGNPVVPTNAQVIAKIGQVMARNIIHIVRMVEEESAVAAAKATIVDKDVTA